MTRVLFPRGAFAALTLGMLLVPSTVRADPFFMSLDIDEIISKALDAYAAEQSHTAASPVATVTSTPAAAKSPSASATPTVAANSSQAVQSTAKAKSTTTAQPASTAAGAASATLAQPIVYGGFPLLSAGFLESISEAIKASTSQTGSSSGGARASGVSLTSSDVGQVISQVVQEAKARNLPATIAVVDRMGSVLAVYTMSGAPATEPVVNNPKGPNATPLVDGLNGVALPAAAEAIAKADTGAYLSTSYGNAFSTRTASQIVQDHFNPGTLYAPSGPLYGVQFSSLPCSDLSVRVSAADPTSLTRGPHRSPLGLAADPGGFPLYKDGQLVGGIGVKATGPYSLDLNIHVNDYDMDEILALAGTVGFDAPSSIRADQISAGGLLLRYSDATSASLRTNPTAAPAFSSLPAGGLTNVPGYYNPSGGLLQGSSYGTPESGLVQDTSGAISATIQPYLLVDDAGAPRYPAIAGAGAAALTQAETTTILKNAYAVALETRAAIRNPPDSQAEITISVVDAYGRVLGIVSTPDAALFGVDVSLQKARSALFLSSTAADGALRAVPSTVKFMNAATSFFGSAVFTQGHAWSERAIGNIARDTYPDGIDGTPNGPLSLSAALTTPFSDGLQLDLIVGNLVQHVNYLINPQNADTPPYCTPVAPPSGSPVAAPILADGLQIFPGGFPIYRGRVLIGGIGVSGDGVDQDDMISFLGLYNAGVALGTGVGHAPQYLRASNLYADGASPRYVNCPYSPFLNSDANNVCSNK